MELTITIRSRPGKFQELYQTLQAIHPTIRNEKGCLDCRIYRDVEDGEILFLSVQWEALASLEHYMQSVSASAFLGAIDVLGKTAKVKIGHDAPWNGIDVLKKMRKSKTPA